MSFDLRTAARFDLHLHSDRSDGRYEPEDVLERAAAGGLRVVAVTDHDVVAPVDPGAHRFGSRELIVLKGAEISGVHDGKEQHLLVYFRAEVPACFLRLCDELVKARRERYATGVSRLGLPGVCPPGEEDGRALTRHHLARALVAAGHATDVQDAFQRWLDARRVPPVALSFVDAIRLSRECGGLTSWAHPAPIDLERHLAAFVAAGLQGVEGFRPRVCGPAATRCRRLARAHGLFLTGGSDWHGWSDAGLGLFAVGAPDLRGFLDAFEEAA